MNGLEVTFYVVGIGGAVAAILGVPAAAAWLLRRLRRANVADTQGAIDKAVQPLSDRLTRIEMQFGPNGGGLRQAVNEGNATAAAIKSTVDGVVARFEDHLVQATDDRKRLGEVERQLMARRRS